MESPCRLAVGTAEVPTANNAIKAVAAGTAMVDFELKSILL